MAIKTVLFDLDGTLLPMEQECFISAYTRGLVTKGAAFGREPEKMVQTLWAGIAAMVRNPGGQTNEEAFWAVYEQSFGSGSRQDEALFAQFYQREFQQIRHVCGFQPNAKALIRSLQERGLQLILATNPFFPAVATCSRIRWAGLAPEDFAHITTYENCCHCKPNPDYYRDILSECDLDPGECLMVGNDVAEDMIARELGMEVFLLTDCLINKKETPIAQFPHGDFGDLMEYCGQLFQSV